MKNSDRTKLDFILQPPLSNPTGSDEEIKIQHLTLITGAY